MIENAKGSICGSWDVRGGGIASYGTERATSESRAEGLLLLLVPKMLLNILLGLEDKADFVFAFAFAFVVVVWLPLRWRNDEVVDDDDDDSSRVVMLLLLLLEDVAEAKISVVAVVVVVDIALDRLNPSEFARTCITFAILLKKKLIEVQVRDNNHKRKKRRKRV